MRRKTHVQPWVMMSLLESAWRPGEQQSGRMGDPSMVVARELLQAREPL